MGLTKRGGRIVGGGGKTTIAKARATAKTRNVPYSTNHSILHPVIHMHFGSPKCNLSYTSLMYFYINAFHFYIKIL